MKLTLLATDELVENKTSNWSRSSEESAETTSYSQDNDKIKKDIEEGAIVFVPKKKKYKTSTDRSDPGLKLTEDRKENTFEDNGGNPSKVYRQGEPPSEATSYYYAPNSTGSSIDSALTLCGQEDTTVYQDMTHTEGVDVGSEGLYPNDLEDTNVTRRPEKDRFKRKDRDKQFIQDESVEPPDTWMQNVEEVMMPLASALTLMAAPVYEEGDLIMDKPKEFKGTLDNPVIYVKVRKAAEKSKVLCYLKMAAKKDPRKARSFNPYVVDAENSGTYWDMGMTQPTYVDLKNNVLQLFGPAFLKSIMTIPRAEDPEKDDAASGKSDNGGRFNVLADPVLAKAAPDMTDVEKLFTTITTGWGGGDTALIDYGRLDAGAQAFLDKVPSSGEGKYKYFWWYYSGEEGATLLVKKLPAWTAIEQKVRAARTRTRNKTPKE